MSPIDIVMLIGGILLTLGTGVFVASEFALVNLDRADVEARRDRGEAGLAPVIGALKVTSTHLSSAQLGITLTTLLTGYLLEPSIAKLLEAPFLAMNLPEGIVETVGSIVALVIATLLSMILGELVPKNFALALPLQTARLVVPLQIAFTTVFKPAVALLNGTANAVLRSLGIEPQEELSGARSAEELTSLLRRSASEGSLEQDTATLLERTISFSELSASDVMTPRPRLSTIRVSESAEDVIALARKTGFSRFPVIEEDADDVVGIVHVKQAVAVPREKRPEVPVGALMTDAERVPETMPGDTLLAEVRGRGYQMVIVVDEYGGTAGVVTLEDLIEEIVGEVSDEHDRARIDVVRSRDWLTFPGLLRPDELEDRAGVKVPEEGPYETVGGFVMSTLGRLPVVGDEVPLDGGVFRVERLDGRRIDRIRWTPTRPSTDTAATAIIIPSTKSTPTTTTKGSTR
ncbi:MULTISPECIES: hemolysin family protein [Curtobacterium]|jgi:CBS domain containing-hemolysin-like protein|uniref:hemolysin family protein n=1 Tax=Curtobacterium TaxID=2034 RepID=UPI000482E561|nr:MULTISPECIES: hemolysin family protein [Curtobacterium]MBF4592975.1 HlyC/CorC family transporter [Curtobacterium flaccumfaciens]MBO9051571.1 HlyC/CorC family transporter [Curtobacterium flaccumfaciens pv. flaccumfaciens]MBT1658114.1 hemolysin family protein [Curtobacterium flaccumfaciens pv. betae]MBT1666075.1 hemolysin family protein [Curtobacterium flaccumfaciens pv. flaccumfaciens]MBT1672341.1 hemolysin family protein [Curtobacterium flaccumfaciens pv. flaccumfaciens]